MTDEPTTTEAEEQPDETIEEDESRAKEAGIAVGKTIASVPKAAGVGVWKGLEGVLVGATRVIPKGAGLWQKWIAIGYSNLKRASKADRINHVQKQGHILHRPIYWNSNKDRWETKNGNNWWKGGKQHLYSGPNGVPCSWAASRATELGDQVQSEISEALELGVERDLYSKADVEVKQMTVDAQASQGAGGGPARADGGNPVRQTTVTARNAGFLQDQVVNLGELYLDEDTGEIADGRVVSMESYYETYPETIDSEEMQKQEDRGKLATMNDRNHWKIALYFMAAALAFVLLWEFLPQFLSGGGGGGGGGGLMPF